jgi:hypothetical protein
VPVGYPIVFSVFASIPPQLIEYVLERVNHTPSHSEALSASVPNDA